MRIITSCPPIEAIWELNRLKYYHKLIRNDYIKNDLPGKIFKIDYKLTCENINDNNNNNNKVINSFSMEIKNLLDKYNLTEYWNVDNMNMRHKEWKKMLNKYIYGIHYRNDLNKLKNHKTTNIFFNAIYSAKLIYDKYRPFKHLLNIFNKFEYRIGAKWMIRFWSGTTPELWLYKQKNNKNNNNNNVNSNNRNDLDNNASDECENIECDYGDWDENSENESESGSEIDKNNETMYNSDNDEIEEKMICSNNNEIMDNNKYICSFCENRCSNYIIHIIENCKCDLICKYRNKYRIVGNTSYALFNNTKDVNNIYNFMKFLNKIYDNVKNEYIE